jgi:hypothetical protein
MTHHCLIDKCIRKQKVIDTKDIVPFSIERVCPHKDTDCPEKDKFIKRVKHE